MGARRPVLKIIGSLLAIAAMAAACEPAPSGVPTRPKKTLANRGNEPPVPSQPIDPQPTEAPATGATPAPTPAPVIPPVVATPTPGPTAEPTLAPVTPGLLGLITAPAPLITNNGAGLISDRGGGILSEQGAGLISDRGGGILSDQGAGLISNNGGGLLSNNGSGLLSNNGGGLIGESGSAYRLLSVSSSPLKNAFLYLTNRDEKFYLDLEHARIFQASSDAEGRYHFPITEANGFPVGKDLIVNVLLNDHQRLTGYLVPGSGTNEFTINLGTTLATEFLRGEAYRAGKPLSGYDLATFKQVADMTQGAIEAGTVATWRQQDGQNLNVFELSMQRVDVLRHQVAVLVSVVDKANGTIKAISDKWKQLIGRRPAAVTTIAGNGNLPAVTLRPYPPNVEGDWRDGKAPPFWEVPIGAAQRVAVAQRGDIFIASDGPDQDDAHIRWIKPSGAITSLWLPNYSLKDARGLVVEKEPTDDPNDPGSLLVAGGSVSLLWRIHIVDTELRDGNGQPRWPMEIVSGLFTSSTVAEHPEVVDGDIYPADTGAAPQNSYWRLYEEGERTYVSNGQPVPNPARFAHLSGLIDVARDEYGNIYLAEMNHHRVRMIVGAAGDGMNFFGYRQPFDDNQDGVVDRFAASPTPMKAGALYTIVGHPSWDPTRTPTSTTGRWFGEYAGDGGRGQLAKLDSPAAVAFHGGHLYVTDSENQRVRKISRATGTIETVAGNPAGGQAGSGTSFYYQPGLEGDGGPATQARLSYPAGLALDAAGRLFIADAGYGRIRMVDTDGTMRTVAGRVRLNGDGLSDHSADGHAPDVDLLGLGGLAVDPDGNLVFTDKKLHRVRKLWRQWE